MKYPVDDFDKFWKGVVKFIDPAGKKAENGDDIYILKSRSILLAGDPEDQIEKLSEKIKIIDYSYELITKDEFIESYNAGDFMDHRFYNRLN